MSTALENLPPADTDSYILNGRGYGPAGEVLDSRAIGFDLGRLRPYMSANGVPCVTINTGKWKRDDDAPGGVSPIHKVVSLEQMRRMGFDVPVGNASIMRSRDYGIMDQELRGVARKRLRFAQKLRDLNTFSGWDGMANENLDYEVVSDFGEAKIDMDGITQGFTSGPLVALSRTPAPITHVDLTFSQRRIAVFSKTGPGLGQLGTMQAGLRIGESIEKMAIGIIGFGPWGNVTTGPFPLRDSSTVKSNVWGLITHPKRMTKTDLTTPTGSNPDAIHQDVLEMRSQMMAASFYGPYLVVHGTDYDAYLDKYYAYTNGSNWAVNPTKTVRQAIREIEGIEDVIRLDWLDSATYPFRMAMIEMQPRNARMAIGLPLTVLQWPSKGGLQQNWKALTIEFPQFVYDYNGVLPVVDATTS